MVMSDASGFGAGGATDVLTVGSSLGGSCNMTDPGKRVDRICVVRHCNVIPKGVDFSFQLNAALQQCRQAHRLMLHLTGLTSAQNLHFQCVRRCRTACHHHGEFR